MSAPLQPLYPLDNNFSASRTPQPQGTRARKVYKAAGQEATWARVRAGGAPREAAPQRSFRRSAPGCRPPTGSRFACHEGKKEQNVRTECGGTKKNKSECAWMQTHTFHFSVFFGADTALLELFFLGPLPAGGRGPQQIADLKVAGV